jgi:uncharacterized membrane protein YeaQ/YmgE (transglycosylase-associated protein family)
MGSTGSGLHGRGGAGLRRKPFLMTNKGLPPATEGRLARWALVEPDYGALSMHIIWTIIIGFVAGIIAKLITPGPNEPSGFILTTILGIVGAFVATYLGQAIGWYRADEGAGFIGAIVGAIIVLVIWGFIAGRRETV